jgi:hypothetical protein
MFILNTDVALAAPKEKIEIMEGVFYELSLKEMVKQLKKKNDSLNGVRIWLRHVVDLRPEGRLVSEGTPVIVVHEKLSEIVKEVLEQGFANNGFEVHNQNNIGLVSKKALVIILDCEIMSFWTKCYIDESFGEKKYISYAEVAFRIIRKDFDFNQEMGSFLLVGSGKLTERQKPEKANYQTLFKTTLEDSISNLSNSIFQLIKSAD